MVGLYNDMQKVRILQSNLQVYEQVFGIMLPAQYFQINICTKDFVLTNTSLNNCNIGVSTYNIIANEVPHLDIFSFSLQKIYFELKNINKSTTIYRSIVS